MRRDEEANFLTRFSSDVTLVHGSEHFRASKIMLDRANPKVKFLTSTVVEEVNDIGRLHDRHGSGKVPGGQGALGVLTET
jgi:thioredoxin reductase